ncbi:MAG: RHS repeat protein [Desulfovibrionales bacterium]|nr:RHS repeat protein [Desulfovibrionales bacterium]
MKSARSLKGWIMSVVLAFSFLFLFASLAGAIDYTYDDLNRLLRVEYDDGTVIEYVYDEVGNRVQLCRVGTVLSCPPNPLNFASTLS